MKRFSALFWLKNFVTTLYFLSIIFGIGPILFILTIIYLPCIWLLNMMVDSTTNTLLTSMALKTGSNEVWQETD